MKSKILSFASMIAVLSATVASAHAYESEFERGFKAGQRACPTVGKTVVAKSCACDINLYDSTEQLTLTLTWSDGSTSKQYLTGFINNCRSLLDSKTCKN
jgi:hypothetical protein